MTEPTNQDQTAKNRKLKNSVGLKLLAVVILAIILLAPTLAIMGLVHERENRKEEAIQEVGSKWGAAQTIAGPVLTIPYKQNETLIKYAHFLPATLDIQGEVNPQTLQRGIYKIVAYHTQLSFNGEFAMPDFAKLDIPTSNIVWDKATLSIGIPDMRGIQENIVVNWNNTQLEAHAGSIFKTQAIQSGVSLPVPISELEGNYTYSFNLKLNGIEQLNFLPLGGETTVGLQSDWSNPSFDGAFLPDSRQITEQGFQATWKILELNRNFPQSFTEETTNLVLGSAFGVNLIVPVDEYQKTMRSVKYAILVIGLTFLIFFFVEVLNKRRIHPIQYVLVGLALVLFYSLLLALSEHINFNLAYLIAGLVTILAISMYARNIFKNIKLTLFQAGCLAVIYAFVFIIIQLQDYALLVGNIGLFVVLVIIMFVSRKVDWYVVGSKNI